MIGIKLLDTIHQLWNQLQQLEDQQKTAEVAWQDPQDQISQTKLKIEQAFGILDAYHAVDVKTNNILSYPELTEEASKDRLYQVQTVIKQWAEDENTNHDSKYLSKIEDIIF